MTPVEKEMLARMEADQREIDRIEGQMIRNGGVVSTEEWDPYYLELEWGEEAMRYVTSRPFAQIEYWIKTDQPVVFRGRDVMPLLKLWRDSGMWAKPKAKQAITPRPTEWGTFS